MLITLSLLALLYVVLGGVIIAAGGGLAVMVVLLAALALGQLWLSERLALRAMHARVVSAQDAPGLHALVERLAIQADVPMPRVAISDIPVPNAFAMGRSPKHATVCVTAGLLHMLQPNELEEYQPEDVVILCTGSQGEPMSALTRIAYHDHQTVTVERGDTVILSARPVPGNELRVHDTINQLSKAGAEVLHEENAAVHVSGHAMQEEIRTLYGLVRPRAVMA